MTDPVREALQNADDLRRQAVAAEHEAEDWAAYAARLRKKADAVEAAAREGSK